MVEINTIKNKLKREELYQKEKSAKAKHKRDRRTALQKEESSNPEKKEVPQSKQVSPFNQSSQRFLSFMSLTFHFGNDRNVLPRMCPTR